MAVSHIPVADLPEPRPICLFSTTFGAGQAVVGDLRNSNDYRDPHLFHWASISSVNLYNTKTDGLLPSFSPAMSGSVAAGSAAAFAPSHGPRGGLLSGCTTTKLNLDSFGVLGYAAAPVSMTWTRTTTTLTVTTSSAHGFFVGSVLRVYTISDAAVLSAPVNVTVVTVPTSTTFTVTCNNAGAASGTCAIAIALPLNGLANRGDGKGYVIRVIDSGVGGTGKTEERLIVGNSSSAQPYVLLAAPLSFTPVAGSKFEILSGRLYMLAAGTTATGFFRFVDAATQFLSGGLAITNLPATIATDGRMFVLDEQYVPYNRNPGEGFLGVLAATGAASGTLTGTVAGGDSALEANEYRNFQIRIVEDTVNVAAVGQRNIISTHTAGPSPVYTMASAWSVTPSSSAKYVIEYRNLVLYVMAGATGLYSYDWLQNFWQAGATFASKATAFGAGLLAMPAFGTPTSADKSHRPSYIYFFRGGSSAALELFDISASSIGAWTENIPYSGAPITPTTGFCAEVDPVCFNGKYAYIAGTSYSQYRFDLSTRTLSAAGNIPYPQGTLVVGGRIAMAYTETAGTKLPCVTIIGNSLQQAWQLCFSGE